MKISENEYSNNVQYNGFERVKLFFMYFTIEPILFCYLLASMFSTSATLHLSMFKACYVDLNNNKSLCANVANRDWDVNDTSTHKVFQDSQKLYSHTVSWSSPLQHGIPALTILFLGAWCDRSGSRKTLIILPILGEVVTTFGKILATYYLLEWPLWVVTVLDCLPAVLFGGMHVLKMAITSYIVDITTVENRVFKLGILGIIAGISIPIGLSISGILTQKLGYYGIYSLVLVIHLFAIFYTMVRVKDKIHHNTDGSLTEKIIKFIHPSNIWDTISLIFRYRGYQLMQVIMVILAHIIRTGPLYGEAPHVYLYASYKFGMDIVEFTLFKSYSVIIALTGVAVSVPIFTRLFKINDAVLGIIGTISDVSSALMYGLATTKALFYFAPILSFFAELAGIAIKSMGAKFIDQDDIGKFYSILGLFDGIGPMIYVPIYSKLYVTTLETFPGAFYVVGATMTFPAIFIFIYLYILYKRLQKDSVQKPEEKDMYAYENAVSSL